MLRLLPYITISIVVYMFLIYMENYQPETLNKIIISVDVLGITDISKYEHYRQDKIKRLDNIGSLEKEVLLNHTVFIGATAQMVEYALGTPKLAFKGKNNVGDLLYYVYFIANDKRPTVFEFSCKIAGTDCDTPEQHKDIFVLNKAYKKSTIDLEHFDVQENHE